MFNEVIFPPYRQVKSLNNEGAEVPNTVKSNTNPAVVAELQRKLEHAQRMLQQADVTPERKTGQPLSAFVSPYVVSPCQSLSVFVTWVLLAGGWYCF